LTLRRGRRLTRDRLGAFGFRAGGTVTLHCLVIDSIFVKFCECQDIVGKFEVVKLIVTRVITQRIFVRMPSRK
jgi:hypothetical protein